MNKGFLGLFHTYPHPNNTNPKIINTKESHYEF